MDCFPFPIFVALRRVFGSRASRVLGVSCLPFLLLATAIAAWRSWRGVPRAVDLDARLTLHEWTIYMH